MGAIERIRANLAAEPIFRNFAMADLAQVANQAEAGKQLAAACERITHCTCSECWASVRAALAAWDELEGR